MMVRVAVGVECNSAEFPSTSRQEILENAAAVDLGHVQNLFKAAFAGDGVPPMLALALLTILIVEDDVSQFKAVFKDYIDSWVKHNPYNGPYNAKLEAAVLLVPNLAMVAVIFKHWELIEFLLDQPASSSSRAENYAQVGRHCFLENELERSEQFLKEALKKSQEDPLLSEIYVHSFLYETLEKAEKQEEAREHKAKFDEMHAAITCAEEEAKPKDDFDWDEAVRNEENADYDPWADELEGDEITLRKWQLLSGCDKHDEPWGEAENLAYMFQAFRPLGNGLDKIFEDIECGDEMLERILPIFQATAKGFKNGNSIDGYFVVRNHGSTTDKKLKRLARSYIASVATLGKLTGAKNLSALSDGIEIKIKRDTELSPYNQSLLDSEHSDVEYEFFEDLERLDGMNHYLDEALYTIACNRTLAHYVLWPVVKQSSSIEDPYRAYFDLWKVGASVRLDSAEQATVYVRPNEARK